ncbi:type II toxin-antitoxin system RelE family toxin [Moraxella equi]|uniref:Plasmid stabilisation system protein n=1 Tax=Moraxella equi TaxID=60442 RepID=A0A378UTV7_9GAMM|nr:hypothetical protein [Moraxella equi]STZ82960.1 Uncharacterised protein [Moraxella equi]STZ82982.1 Uncharacterised protein [Moraxella equi]
MKYEIILAKGVEDFLDSIPQKHARQIVKKIDLLAQDPHTSSNGAIKRISTPKTGKKWRISHNFSNC